MLVPIILAQGFWMSLTLIFEMLAPAVLNIAFWMSVAYLGGVLFGPDVPETKSGPTADSQSRSWNPHSTQQEGIARPRAYGRNMHHGNIVAKWTDVIDNRERLHMIVEHGDGPTKGIVVIDGVKQVFLNDQPAANFTSVEIQEKLGTMNQTCMTGFEKTKLEYEQNNKLEKDTPIIVTTPNDFFDDIEYTILFPNGLLKYQKDGDRKTSTCTIKVRIRVHPDGGWTTIFNQGISARSLIPLFKLYTVSELWDNVARGAQYDLEFTNLTGPGGRHVNDVYLRSFREVVDVAFTRPGKALVGIRAIATEQLSGRIDVKVVREDRLVRVYNGSTWSIEYSRNRSWIAFDALTQPVISGDGDENPWTIEHYEGIDPSHLDLTFFYNWAEFCSTQVPDGYGGTEGRIACDTILDFQTDVWSFVNEIANIGRASLYWQGHTLTGWIDKAVTEVTDLVTMDNIMARTWKNAWTDKNELAGRVEVFFNDSRQGYERTHAPLPNESAGRYTRIISIEGIGITTRGTAIHVANHALERNRLIRNVNSFREYKDAFRYKLGNIIRIQHRTPNWGASYRVIKSTANNKVTLDRVCDASGGDLIFIRAYDEANKKVDISSYTVASVSGKVVTIEETWDVTPIKNCICAIGEAGKIQTRRITKIEATVENYFDITVETYDPDLFDADDLVPDNPDQNYIWAQPANPLTRPVTRAEVAEMINQLMIPQPDIDVPQTSNCTWTGDEVDTVTWSKTDATEPIIFRYKGVSYEITADSTTDEFIYWDPDYTTTFRHTNDATVAFALGKWIMCRNKDGVAYPATPMQLVHAGILLAGTIRAEQYAELRNTYVYNSEDSLDNAKPFTIPFKIVSEMTAIQSIKLSFKLMPYRAYSTAAASGGAATSGTWGGPTESGGSGSTGADGTGQTGQGSVSGTTGASGANGASVQSQYVASVPSSHGHSFSGGSHSHSFSGGSHAHSGPSHTHSIGGHTHNIGDHTHSTPNHIHGVTYGIHEESNSPTVHYHIDNGAGFGDASADYNSDQTDLVITGSITGTGWKAIRFDTNLRCRIAAIIECKLDITA